MKIYLLAIILFVSGSASFEDISAQQTALPIRTVETFRRIEPNMTMKQVIKICGLPDEEIGSGIHIYVYKLSDGSIMRIGTPITNG